MRHRFFAVALFLAAAAVPAAAADMSNNCRLDLRMQPLRDGIYAIVVIDSTWGALIDADVRLTANGQEIKVEPVLTDTQFVSGTRVGPIGTTVVACATVEGRNWITNEVSLPIQTTDCGYYSSETSKWMRRPGTPPRAPLSAPASSSLMRLAP